MWLWPHDGPCCVNKHGSCLTSGGAAIVPLTLVSSVAAVGWLQGLRRLPVWAGWLSVTIWGRLAWILPPVNGVIVKTSRSELGVRN